jgi:IS5 family transposase
VVDGFALVEKLDWDSYNEGITLQESIENYRKRFGYYPEAILADKIYRNRENLNHCKKLGIRLSGPMGPPSKEDQRGSKRLEKSDASERNAVEGKFGECKRRYGLGLIRARLQDTSETVISLQFLIMNLEQKLRVLFCRFLWKLFGRFATRKIEIW